MMNLLKLFKESCRCIYLDESAINVYYSNTLCIYISFLPWLDNVAIRTTEIFRVFVIVV